jgi:hypothetical protein
MAKKNKNTKGQRFLPLALMVVIGVLCGLLMPNALDRLTEGADTFGDVLTGYLVFFLSVFVGIIFQTIVHEGGHLIFGLLSGYRFRSFRVFNLMWIMEDGKLRCKRLSVAGTAGQCLMAPPDPVDGKIPVVLYNMGGSILNGVFAVVFFALYMVLEPLPVLSGLMMLFAMMGFLLAVSNAIPMMTALIPNDGHNALSLRKDPEAMRAFWIQLKISESTADGIRLKDMPSEWFEMPTHEAMQNGVVCATAVYACARLIDEDRLEDAREQIEKLLAADTGLIGLHRNLLISELIFMETVGQNRQEVIQPLLTKEFLSFQKKMATNPGILRTQYACALLIEHDPQKAQKLKQQFEKAAKQYPYPQELEQEYEFMQLVEAKAQSAVM